MRTETQVRPESSLQFFPGIIESFFPAILNSLEEPIFLLDETFRLVWYNRACNDIYYSVSGRHLDHNFDLNELLTKEQQPLLVERLHRVMEGERVHLEWKYQISVIKWLSVSLYPFRSCDGTFSGVCGNLRDITEQKQLSDEIEVLALLAQETTNAVIILHPDGEMLWMNEGFSRLTGYAREDFMGKSSRSFLNGPDSNMETLKKAAYCRQNGLPLREEFVIYTKAGQKVWTRAHGQPVRRWGGSVTHYFLIITDITKEKNMMAERLRMEEERRQNEVEQQKKITHAMLHAQEMERNALGRELHDNINQILAAIRLQLSYSLKNFLVCKPVLRQCRENIIQAIEETRLLSHKMVMPRFSERSLPQVLKGLADNYRTAHAIRLHMDNWKDEGIAVRIKEVLYRIAQEQLSNIYKHARANEISICISNEERFALLTIDDDGVGFDPYQKKGGIGLSNIHSRAESYDGTAEFISAPGKGCRLLVTIPLDQAI